MTRLLVKLTTRERPSRAISTIRNFKDNATNQYKMIVSLDEDDHTIGKDTILAMEQYGAEIKYGKSTSKVGAINRDIPSTGWDVLVVIADDHVASPGWDQKIIGEMESHWPNYDGALHFNDGYTTDTLCTMPVIGVNLYKKFGYVYHQDYKSLWCDNEYTDILKASGRMWYSPNVIIRHCHPSHPGGVKADDLLRRTESWFGRDEATYRHRASTIRPSSFIGFDMPEVSLSIGICSLTSRHNLRTELLEVLNNQIQAISEPFRVDILLAIDGGQESVGGKRQRILDASRGRFLAFVDDDDMVSPDYVQRIINTIDSGPTVDCISLRGIITSGGVNPKIFEHSIKHNHYHESPTEYYRPPNHLNPISTTHAKHVGFQPIGCGEDYAFAMAMVNAGLLKTEGDLGQDPVYYYRYDPKTTATQRR